MVHSGIRRDSLPGCGYVVWQDAGEFTFTTDSVFVAAFAHLVKKAQVLELGSGTGAISLFLAARGAEKVTGIEFNPKVAALMERSIKDNGLEETVKVIGGDLREINKYFKTESMDLVIANPPYVTRQEMEALPRSVKNFEPAMALFGGEDGLDFYRAIARNFTAAIKPGGYLALEFGQGQEDAVCWILEAWDYEILKLQQDAGGITRAVLAQKKERD